MPEAKAADRNEPQGFVLEADLAKGKKRRGRKLMWINHFD